jgi:hypothetical protein
VGIGVALVVVITLRVWYRWRKAGEYSNAMAAEEHALRGLHAQLLGHPARGRQGC